MIVFWRAAITTAYQPWTLVWCDSSNVIGTAEDVEGCTVTLYKTVGAWDTLHTLQVSGSQGCLWAGMGFLRGACVHVACYVLTTAILNANRWWGPWKGVNTWKCSHTHKQCT